MWRRNPEAFLVGLAGFAAGIVVGKLIAWCAP
jgi:hypothetical protein